jgi:uncharacterized protein
MRVLIDIGHPGHVHLFKHFAREFIQKGHDVLFTVREKEHESELLKSEKLPFTKIGRHYTSGPGKLWGLIYYNIKILFISFRFNPDVYLSHGSVYTLLSAILSGKPNIALEDSGNKEQVRIYLPFTRAVLTSTSFPYRYGRKQVLYNGYHELAYLHPNYFTPDPGIYKELGLADGEAFSIIRFVAWNASHDRKNTGLTTRQKYELVQQLALHGRVYISSESILPPDLEKLRFPLNPERLHHAIAFAMLTVGEGATIASESAVLGTAAIYVNTIPRGYLEEQERDYGLVSCFRDFEGVMTKMQDLMDRPGLKAETKMKSERLIKDKCDLTGLMVRFIEGWPESFGRTVDTES